MVALMYVFTINVTDLPSALNPPVSVLVQLMNHRKLDVSLYFMGMGGENFFLRKLGI